MPPRSGFDSTMPTCPSDIGRVDLFVRQLGSLDPLTPVWALICRGSSSRGRSRTIRSPARRRLRSRVQRAEGGPIRRARLARSAFALAGHLLHRDIRSPLRRPRHGVARRGGATRERMVRTGAKPRRAATAGPPGMPRRSCASQRARRSVRVSYCLPPGPIGGLRISVCPLEQSRAVWSTRIAWHDADWHEDSIPLRLADGDYVVSFDAEATWSNPGAGRPRILGGEPLPWLRALLAVVRGA